MTREEFLNLKDGDKVVVTKQNFNHSFVANQEIKFQYFGNLQIDTSGHFLGTSFVTGNKILQRLNYNEVEKIKDHE